MMIFFVGKNQGNASEPRKIPSSPAPPSIPKEDSGRTTQGGLPREDYPGTTTQALLRGLPGGTTHLLGTTTGRTTY